MYDVQVRRVGVFLALALSQVAPAQVLRFPDFGTPARVWSGSDTGVVESRYLVIGDAKAWAALWRQHDPGAAVPQVDFSVALVLAVFRPRWGADGFLCDRIAPGALASDQSSFNVHLRATAPQQGKHPVRFLMIQVDRTRREFRFYAKDAHPTTATPRLVARVESYRGPAPVASLRAAARTLLDEHRKASPARKRRIIVELATIGEPLRPFLNELVAAGGPDLWVCREVLTRMLDEEARVAGKPIRHAEVALAKATAEVLARLGTVASPWFAEQQVRHVQGVWFVVLRGTYRVLSDREAARQPDVAARIAFRAADGGLLRCEVQRGDDRRTK